jgi:23S rRNA (cytosine1962-C5)-methyltransferase
VPTPRLKIRLSAPGERAVKAGHPWVFSESIQSLSRPGEAGELAVIYDRSSDRFLASAFYDPDSPIRLRIVHRGPPAPVDLAFWQNRVRTALAARSGVFDRETTGGRLIHGENDGFPALVLDRYADTCVCKLYSPVWIPHLPLITEAITSVIQPASLMLRLSRNAAPLFSAAGLAEGWLSGEAPDSVSFLEDGLLFFADVRHGQKTGFYLDQRENRRRLATLARDAHVLNAFSFSSGFSLHAARGGARSVTDVDISQHALDSGSRNFAANAHLPTVAQCHRHMVQADAFAWLAARPASLFDIAVVDPPSLARRESDRPAAIRAYHRLATATAQHLKPHGMLLAASCSAHVSPAEFFDAVRAALPDARELWTAGHAPDHPARFPEATYLKAIALQLPARPLPRR